MRDIAKLDEALQSTWWHVRSDKVSWSVVAHVYRVLVCAPYVSLVCLWSNYVCYVQVKHIWPTMFRGT